MRIETKEIEKYSIKYGDLIICEGGEPGRCAVWDRNDSIFIRKHYIEFVLKMVKIPSFICIICGLYHKQEN